MTGEWIPASSPTWLALVLVSIGTILDTLQHRLPNMLTVTGLVAGLGVQGWVNGGDGFMSGMMGALVAMALFFPFFAMRWMGAGDVKLLMAVGACLGWRSGLVADLATLGIGAVAAFLLLARSGGLMRYLQRYGGMFKCLLTTGQFAYIPPQPGETATERFPYAFAIALGTLTALFGMRDLARLRNLLGI